MKEVEVKQILAEYCPPLSPTAVGEIAREVAELTKPAKPGQKRKAIEFKGVLAPYCPPLSPTATDEIAAELTKRTKPKRKRRAKSKQKAKKKSSLIEKITRRSPPRRE